MDDILANPYFIPDPVPYAFAAKLRVPNAFPHVKGHTWVSPHPEAWHKLGYYHVWRPVFSNQEPDWSMQEVFGEDAVRSALLENVVDKVTQ